MSFFDDIARDAKIKEKFNNSDWFLPGQEGVLQITKVVQVKKLTKLTVFLEGKIVESRPTVSGGATQTPGTAVKKCYALSKFDWAANEMVSDLMSIVGMDVKSPKPEIAAMLQGAFEGGVLEGVVCTFKAVEKKRDGKPSITQVFFGHLDEKHGNSDAEIAARK